eukprot:SAG31_NODE_1207_length_9383_cov_5.316351_1_plen_89_part_00
MHRGTGAGVGARHVQSCTPRFGRAGSGDQDQFAVLLAMLPHTEKLGADFAQGLPWGKYTNKTGDPEATRSAAITSVANPVGGGGRPSA